MAKKKIEVTIMPDGTVEGEAFGYEGKGCVDALRGVTTGMKAEVRRKPDFFKETRTKVSSLRYGTKNGGK